MRHHIWKGLRSNPTSEVFLVSCKSVVVSLSHNASEQVVHVCDDVSEILLPVFDDLNSQYTKRLIFFLALCAF